MKPSCMAAFGHLAIDRSLRALHKYLYVFRGDVKEQAQASFSHATMLPQCLVRTRPSLGRSTDPLVLLH